MVKNVLKQLVFVSMMLAVLFGALQPMPVAASAVSAPPANMFQWPWGLGQNWQITQGPHGTNLSGLDINNGSLPWNSSARHEVRAAAGGTAKVFSSCYVEIDHGNGWKTGYVHIRAEISSGPVSANQVIGILETNQSRAQCDGRADGPHLHFRLFYNGAETSIIGTTFGGWTVGVESGYAPNNSKRSLYTKNGVTKYIYQLLDNTMATPPNTGIVNGRTYSIHPSTNTGLALDIYGGAAKNDAKIAQWGYHGGPNQLWVALQQGDGSFKFSSVLNRNKCIVVQYASRSAGTKLILHDCNSNVPNVNWKMEQISGLKYTFRNVYSNLVMDVPGSKQDWGLQMQQWGSNGSAAQQFQLVQR